MNTMSKLDASAWPTPAALVLLLMTVASALVEGGPNPMTLVLGLSTIFVYCYDVITPARD